MDASSTMQGISSLNNELIVDIFRDIGLVCVVGFDFKYHKLRERINIDMLRDMVWYFKLTDRTQPEAKLESNKRDTS